MSWSNINEYVLLKIYELLSTWDIERAGQTCRRWWSISKNDLLWKRIVINSFFGALPKISLGCTTYNPSPGTSSWIRKAIIKLFDTNPDSRVHHTDNDSKVHHTCQVNMSEV